MNHQRIAKHLMVAGIAVTAPAWAVSLTATNPAQPVPVSMDAAAPKPLETWTVVAAAGGSGALVPLMAADMQSGHTASVEAPADAAGGAAGKPVDDVAFVRQATESGRKEVASARDALPQLKNPGLKRIAEMLVSDHSNANAKLSKIAEAKGWPLPAPQAATPPAATGASTDFDAKWTAEMIAGHEKSIALYRAQAQGGEDKDLRKYAHDTLPTIEHHLAELRSLQK